MSLTHTPVMVEEILAHMEEIKGLNSMIDLSFGRGGHTLAIKKKWPHLKIVAIDRDLEAVKSAHQMIKEGLLPSSSKEGGFYIYHQNMVDLKQTKDAIFKECHIEKGVDACLADLGVSSPQLEDASRGFSFYKEGPLDMRMDCSQETSLQAKDIVNNWSEQELIDLFKEYGEVRKPYSVVKAILRARKNKPLETTQDLSKVIMKVLPWKRRGRHPATSYFLALRIQVNDELEIIEQSLSGMIEALNPGGRVFVLTFHSLEDRIVKFFFKRCSQEQLGYLVNKKVIKPSRAEILSNPRSRSAQLRIFEKASEGAPK